MTAGKVFMLPEGMSPGPQDPVAPPSNSRSRRIRFVLAHFVLFAAFAAMVLGANPFRGETITPLDLLISQRAWSWVDPDVKPKSNQRSDVLNAILPQWIDARTQLRVGHFPTWNPNVAGGIPHTTPSYNSLTPGFAIFAAMPNPATGFLLAMIFNLAVAALGMFLFLRRRLGWLSAVAGAITFEFCGFNAAWLYWPHVFTLMWAPWLLLSIDRCAARPSTRTCFEIAVVSALVVLGGFPFLGEIIFGAGALYAMLLTAIERPPSRSRFISMYVIGTVIGFALCALPMLEFVAWMRQYDLAYRDNRGSSLGLRHVSRLMAPWAYRHLRVEETMYVGMLMFVAALLALGSTAVRWRSPMLLPVFGTALVLVTGGLVFGLWPMWLIGWFPGMYFNSWSRAIGVMDVALVILGASTIDAAWRCSTIRRRRVAQVLLVLLVCAQSAEMIGVFRRFNGEVPAHAFYPRTPAISYMQANVGPFDHVIADRSFLMSGTLGAYGLNEWFGHQFRTPGLRAALEAMARRPFSSPTATRLPPENIRREATAMAAFNVRYLAISSEDPVTRQALLRSEQARVSRKALPSMPMHRPRQMLAISSPIALSGISVRMATYHRHDLRGRLDLMLTDAGPSAHPVARVSIDAATVVDNRMAEFFFPTPRRLLPGDYVIALDYRPAAGSPPLTAWSLAIPDAQGLSVDGTHQTGSLDLVLHQDPPAASRFRRVFTAAGITILENRHSPNGPYFMADLKALVDASASRNVAVAAWRRDRFKLRYTGTAAGYVIVPMKMASGWRIFVDGRAVAIRRAADVMPAVPVSGPATIDFRYEPAWRPWWGAWLGLLAALIGLSFALSRRMRGSLSADPRG